MRMYLRKFFARAEAGYRHSAGDSAGDANYFGLAGTNTATGGVIL